MTNDLSSRCKDMCPEPATHREMNDVIKGVMKLVDKEFPDMLGQEKRAVVADVVQQAFKDSTSPVAQTIVQNPEIIHATCDLLYAAGKHVRKAWKDADVDGDGRISRKECKGCWKRVFCMNVKKK